MNQSGIRDWLQKDSKTTRIWETVAYFALVAFFCAHCSTSFAAAPHPPVSGLASWYGEEHRGKLMANGKPFDPDGLTAASWSFPLGAKVRVTLNTPGEPRRSVLVTITDRGPSHELVRQGRVIDLSRAAFEKLAPIDLGLVEIEATQQ
jgi:rare lipoprotein A